MSIKRVTPQAAESKPWFGDLGRIVIYLCNCSAILTYFYLSNLHNKRSHFLHKSGHCGNNENIPLIDSVRCTLARREISFSTCQYTGRTGCSFALPPPSPAPRPADLTRSVVLEMTDPTRAGPLGVWRTERASAPAGGVSCPVL